MYERIYAVAPERLARLLVAVDADDVPIGLAGLRTRATDTPTDPRMRQIMRATFGSVRYVQYQAWVRLSVPPPYQVQDTEAYLHSLTVTARWRGQRVTGALLNRMHAWAGELGTRQVVAEVEADTVAARRLFQRAGYTERQRRYSVLARLPGGPAPRLVLVKRVGIA